MPQHRPGHVRVDVAHASLTINHAAPCVVDGIPGIAIKQKTDKANVGLQNPPVIAATEPFNQIIHGKVLVPNSGSGVSAANVGTLLYIIPASNLLTTTATAGNVTYGRIIEKAGVRGVPTGFCRVDLDQQHVNVAP